MALEAPQIPMPQLVAELRTVRRTGLANLARKLTEVPGLAATATYLHGSGAAEAVELTLREAWEQLGDSPHGRAAGVLLGLERGHRGGSPADLRHKAAEGLGYFSVDTFRKHPEEAVLTSLAQEIVNLRAQRTLLDRRQGEDRVSAIVAAIEALTTVESAELARRLRRTLTD